MSEFQEAYTVSTLKGSPPGYLGHGKGGVLTEAVRRNPYCVVLLDEVEKAHPDVLELFYPVFDKGTLEDSEGLAVDFRNTVILLTSSVGTEAIANAMGESRTRPDADELGERLRADLAGKFPPALLGRLVVVPFYPLGPIELRSITARKLSLIQQRFRAHHSAELTFADALAESIAARFAGAHAGARQVDHLMTKSLLPALSREVLARTARGERCPHLRVELDSRGEFACVALSTGHLSAPQQALPYEEGVRAAPEPDATPAPRSALARSHRVLLQCGRGGVTLCRKGAQGGLAAWRWGRPKCARVTHFLTGCLSTALAWSWQRGVSGCRHGVRLVYALVDRARRLARPAHKSR